MSIEMISGVTNVTASPAAALGSGARTSDFADWIAREATALNNQLQHADATVQRLASGDGANLHTVMMDLEKAKLSFELVVQVRNRLLEGYQEVMRMQV